MAQTSGGDQQWVPVPPEVARQYRFYGMNGWLLFFLVLLTLFCIGAAVGWIRLTTEILPVLDRLPQPGRFRFIVALLLLTALIVWLAVALIRGYGLKRSFPNTVRWYLAFAVVASALFSWLLLDRVGPGRAIGPVISHGLLIWYFTASKRVNATYLHRLDPRHPSSAALLESAGSVAPAAPAAPPAAAWPSPAPGPATAASVPPEAPAPSPAPTPSPAPAGSPGPTAERSLQERLLELKALFEQGLIDEPTYRERQAAIIRDL